MKKKTIAIFGAGRFSSYIVKRLSNVPKFETILIEKDEQAARALSEFSDEVYVGDATDEAFLKKLNLKNVDVFVVGIGDNIQNSIFICSTILENYKGKIIAKAVDLRHEEILRKIGITEIINLQVTAARSALLKIINPILGTYSKESITELDEDTSIFRDKVPKSWVNKKVLDININDISIILLRRNKKNLIVTGNTVLKENDTLIIVGRNSDLAKLITKTFKK